MKVHRFRLVLHIVHVHFRKYAVHCLIVWKQPFHLLFFLFATKLLNYLIKECFHLSIFWNHVKENSLNKRRKKEEKRTEKSRQHVYAQEMGEPLRLKINFTHFRIVDSTWKNATATTAAAIFFSLVVYNVLLSGDCKITAWFHIYIYIFTLQWSNKNNNTRISFSWNRTE